MATSSNTGKTILITGASSGIGLESARLFHQKGWNVIATMRDTADAAPWMDAQNVLPLPLDVTDHMSIESAVRGAKDFFGRIDVLLNNAGYGLNGPLEGATDQQIRRQFDVNFFGLIDVTKAVLPHMRAARSGLIMNVSSIGGLIGMPISPLYIASKHAVEGLSESMRFELKPFGVRVKIIEPGGIQTDFLSRSQQWTEHPAYAGAVAAAKQMTHALNGALPGPDGVVRVIYRAATDPTDRLRYLAKPGPYVALYRMLPDPLWRGMIQAALSRAPAPQQ